MKYLEDFTNRLTESGIEIQSDIRGPRGQASTLSTIASTSAANQPPPSLRNEIIVNEKGAWELFEQCWRADVPGHTATEEYKVWKAKLLCWCKAIGLSLDAWAKILVNGHYAVQQERLEEQKKRIEERRRSGQQARPSSVVSRSPFGLLYVSSSTATPKATPPPIPPPLVETLARSRPEVLQPAAKSGARAKSAAGRSTLTEEERRELVNQSYKTAKSVHDEVRGTAQDSVEGIAAEVINRVRFGQLTQAALACYPPDVQARGVLYLVSREFATVKNSYQQQLRLTLPITSRYPLRPSQKKSTGGTHPFDPPRIFPGTSLRVALDLPSTALRTEDLDFPVEYIPSIGRLLGQNFAVSFILPTAVQQDPHGYRVAKLEQVLQGLSDHREAGALHWQIVEKYRGPQGVATACKRAGIHFVISHSRVVVRDCWERGIVATHYLSAEELLPESGLIREQVACPYFANISQPEREETLQTFISAVDDFIDSRDSGRLFEKSVTLHNIYKNRRKQRRDNGERSDSQPSSVEEDIFDEDSPTVPRSYSEREDF